MEGDDVVFKTGDPLVDKWEEQLARGEQPNLDEFFSDEENRALEEQAKAAEQAAAGFSDDYTGDSKAGAVQREAQDAPVLTPFTTT